MIKFYSPLYFNQVREVWQSDKLLIPYLTLTQKYILRLSDKYLELERHINIDN